MSLTRRSLLAAPAALLAPRVAGAEGKTLRYALTTMPNVIDPHFSTGFQVRDVTYAVFDTLFAVDHRYRPTPQMVDRWTVSDDGLTYRFTLRAGLAWHDGTPVTAEDCVLSIRRWSARDAMGSLLRAATARMEPLDAGSFELVLARPFAFVLDALAKPGSNVPAMLPKRFAALPPTTPITELIGSGPFKHLPAESLSGQTLVFARNEAYVPRAEPPDWASGGKVVRIDRLEMIAMPDPSTQFNALLNGEVEYIERLQADLMPLLKTTARGKMRPIHTSAVQLVVRLNHLQPPFDNLLARRAVLHALNQQELIDATVGDTALKRTCGAVFGCGGPYATETGAPQPDMAEAKRLLAQSGVDLSIPVVQLYVAGDPTVTPAAELIAHILRQLGFALDQQVMDFATFAQRRLKMGPMSEGGWNVANTTIGTTELANPLAAQPVIASGRTAMWGWPSDDTIEALRQRFAQTSDPAERRQLAAEIQAAVYADVATIPGGEIMTTSAVSPRAKDALEAPMVLFWGLSL